MQNEMIPFLQQGLREYVDAENTLSAFEQEMSKRLKVLVDKHDWNPLRNPKVSRANPGRGKGGYGHWIAVSVKGDSPHNGAVRIDCGLWWRTEYPTEPILYASFEENPRSKLMFSWTDEEHGIQSFPWDGRTILFLPMPTTLEMKDPLSRLFKALLKQLK